jgi:hypothetical protein
MNMRAKRVNEEQRFERGQDPKDALEIGVGEKLKMEALNAFTHFMYHVNGEDMIQKVWGGWDHIRNKLKSKVGDGYLDPNALMKFITDLDNENQELLFRYILKNHSNKW